MARFWSGQLLSGWLGRDFPWGTLIINLSGSLAMGALYVLLVERTDLPTEWRSLLMVGLLGAFTTYSTYSLETLLLIEQGAWLRATTNTLLNGIGCVAAAAIGLQLARWLTPPDWT